MKTLNNNTLVVVIISFLFTVPVYAQQVKLPEHCLDKSIKAVQAKVDSSSKKMFTYYYQKITKHNDSSKPTFIIIPGGPGRSAMTDSQATFMDPVTARRSTDTELYWGLPIQSNVILTGPRSVDCNANNNLPSSSYSTKNIVQDLVALIKKEKLSNYIIVGRSYGTVVATQLVHYIENKEGLLKPQAVLLTGVLGHSIHIDDQAKNVQAVWGQLYSGLSERLQKLFPPNVAAITNSEDFVFPLGIKTQTWLNMIFAKLTIGFNYFSYEVELETFLKNLGQTLSQMSSTSKNGYRYLELKQHLQILKNQVKAYAPKQIDRALGASPKKEDTLNNTSEKSLLFKVITQKEIYRGLQDNADESQFWNSNNWQIKTTPVIYFQGSWDIAVPLDNALSHYKGQKNKKHKYFITAKKGGHDILSGLNDCKENFWKAASKQNFANMISIVENCDPNFSVLK
ncbi:MAG: alpha/beta hydrolase [Bdellovibrionaceae bacterium]|nr:alpha/beta hydrolase [Pseudobdellovibrionaceae bacterium]